MSLWDAEKESRGVMVRPIYVRAGGDLVTGTLLSQLAYWFKPDKDGKSKLKIQMDGKLWLAKSREELCAECSMTLDQYRRAIRVLIDKGLVETRVKIFAGRTVAHFWLNIDAVFQASQAGGSSLDYIGDNAPTGLGDNPSTTLGDHAPTITETVKTTAEITPKHGGQGASMKVLDILAKKKEQAAGTATLRWKSNMAQIYGFQKDLTIVEKSQLKQVCKIAGDKSYPLIDYVTQNWLKYVNFVKTKMGLNIGPTIPTVGFLLKYADLGLQLIADDEEQPEKPKTKIKYVYED